MPKPISILSTTLFLVGFFFSSSVWACSGSPLPPSCPQSAYVAKYPLAMGINPGSGDVTLPIALSPGAFWDNLTTTCAAPVDATLTLELTCSTVLPGPPVTFGTPVMVGPLDVPVDTPIVPGIQTISGGMFPVVIPAGTLPAGPFVCDVVGTYSISFGSGIGSGTVSGGGDTQVCFVDPAPDDTDNTIPRLDMQLLEPDDLEGSVIRTHQGDQERLFFGVLNNDPSESVDVEFGVTTNQVARFPEGDNSDNTFFAFSDPTPNTDNFPVQFGDVIGGELITLPDPTLPGDQLITREFTLPPSGIAIIPVDVRNHGMCVDGSCSEIKVYANGQYSDNTAERACSGGAILVDNSQPLQTPQCKLSDLVQTAQNVDSQWSPGHFGDDHLSTFANGHLNPFASQPTQPLTDSQTGDVIIQTTGEPLAQQFDQPFPPMLHSSLATDSFGGVMQFSMTGFPEEFNFQQQRMQVTVTSVPPDNGVIVPLIGKQNSASNLMVEVNPANDTLLVIDADNQETLFDGPASELQANPTNGLFVDTDTFRMITKEDLTDRNTMTTNPLGIAELFTSSQTPTTATVEVLNAQTQEPISWQASITKGSEAVSLTADSGPAGTPIELNFNLDNIALSPETTLATLNVVNNAMLNSPLDVPIALRKTDFTPASRLQFSAAEYQVDEFGNVGTMAIEVVRLDSTEGEVSVDYRSTDGSAQSGTDFSEVSGTLTWADGDAAAKSITIAITDDDLVELDEDFMLALANPSSDAVLGTPDTATVSIIDNDEAVVSAGIGVDGSPRDSDSRFGGSISSDSGDSGASLSVTQNDPVTVRGRFLIDVDDVGKTAQILILALYTPPSGPSLPLMRDGLFWRLWDGELGSLTSAETRTLDSFFDITVIENIPLVGLSGRLDFFFAYSSEEIGLIFNGLPLLSLTVE